MKSDTPKAKRVPRLQTLDLVEITDPAEQAALDKRCREAEKTLAAAAANAREAKNVKKRPRSRSVPPAA